MSPAAPSTPLQGEKGKKKEKKKSLPLIITVNDNNGNSSFWSFRAPPCVSFGPRWNGRMEVLTIYKPLSAPLPPTPRLGGEGWGSSVPLGIHVATVDLRDYLLLIFRELSQCL